MKGKEDVMTTANDARLLLRVPDVAHRLSIGRSIIYQLIKSGALPSVKIKGSRLVRAADLEAYVRSLPTA